MSGAGRNGRDDNVECALRTYNQGCRQIAVMEKQVVQRLFAQTHTVTQDHLVLHHHHHR